MIAALIVIGWIAFFAWACYRLRPQGSQPMELTPEAHQVFVNEAARIARERSSALSQGMSTEIRRAK